MRKLLLLIVLACGLATVWTPPDAMAMCEVRTSLPVFADRQVLSAETCNANGQTGGAVGDTSPATATEAEASAVEGASTTLSVDLRKVLRTTLSDLLSCEDQLNQLCMVSGGKSRLTQVLGTGGIPSTATDATSATSALPIGKKTFFGVVTCTGTCVQTQKIYGTWTNAAANGEELCTITLSDTTNAHASCNVDSTWMFYYVTTTLTSGTTPLAGVFAQY